MTGTICLPSEHSHWLKNKGLQRLFDVLDRPDEATRAIGGSVRNSILGEPISDIDLCTTLLPEQVLDLLRDAKIRAVETGLSHGTVTAVIDGTGYEITTLRKDKDTDGRHAIVEFGRDWKEDASRRDLTMNAIYCDRYGEILDPLGGYEDVLNRNVRFIGDALKRIEEDHLRILRFFRFFAQYGKGRPDAEGLKACARLKGRIDSLSVERVWAEFKKILSVEDPGRSLLWMRTTGVLTQILPEGEHWGIDYFPDLIDAERDLGWGIDYLTRLQIILPPNREKTAQLAGRLKFSNAEKERMEQWVDAPLPGISTTKDEQSKILYRHEPAGVIDRLRNEVVRYRHKAREDDSQLALAQNYLDMFDDARSWVPPQFPLRGQDLLDAGQENGPALGELLRRLEEEWIESGFSLDKAELLARV